MDIFIAWNDDPTHAWQCRFENWSEFFEYVDDREEIDLRVQWAIQVEEWEDKGHVSLSVDAVPPHEILGWYDEWQEQRRDDTRAEHAERSAYQQRG